MLRITLAKRGVSCLAEMLEKEAPRTCDAVWAALPQKPPPRGKGSKKDPWDKF